MGFQVVTVPFRGKNPILKGWGTLQIDISNFETYFKPPFNVGLLLGKRSGWLCDVDLDSVEARNIAPFFLPLTLRSERQGSPCSHWWFISEGIKGGAYKDPLTPVTVKNEHADMILELRAPKHNDDGAWQTVVCPSYHKETGEKIFWQEIDSPENLIMPLTIKPEELIRLARIIATCNLLQDIGKLQRGI